MQSQANITVPTDSNKKGTLRRTKALSPGDLEEFRRLQSSNLAPPLNRNNLVVTTALPVDQKPPFEPDSGNRKRKTPSISHKVKPSQSFPSLSAFFQPAKSAKPASCTKENQQPLTAVSEIALEPNKKPKTGLFIDTSKKPLMGSPMPYPITRRSQAEIKPPKKEHNCVFTFGL